MTKNFYNRHEICEMCGYTADEYVEYFGDKCIGLVAYEEVDETLYEISVMFDGGEIYYEFNEGGDSFIRYDDLKTFEDAWVNN